MRGTHLGNRIAINRGIVWATRQELAKAEAEFQALRQKVEQETGFVYNDQTLVLEPKGK